MDVVDPLTLFTSEVKIIHMHTHTQHLLSVISHTLYYLRAQCGVYTHTHTPVYAVIDMHTLSIFTTAKAQEFRKAS